METFSSLELSSEEKAIRDAPPMSMEAGPSENANAVVAARAELSLLAEYSKLYGEHARVKAQLAISEQKLAEKELEIVRLKAPSEVAKKEECKGCCYFQDQLILILQNLVKNEVEMRLHAQLQLGKLKASLEKGGERLPNGAKLLKLFVEYVQELIGPNDVIATPDKIRERTERREYFRKKFDPQNVLQLDDIDEQIEDEKKSTSTHSVEEEEKAAYPLRKCYMTNENAMEPQPIQSKDADVSDNTLKLDASATESQHSCPDDVDPNGKEGMSKDQI